MTTSINAQPDPIKDPNGYEESDRCALRQELGLRPVFYRDDTDATKSAHPDQRGCPSWCWVAAHPEYGHSVDWMNPLDAAHTIDRASMALAHYRGELVHDDDDDVRGVGAATLEFRLDQVGQGSSEVVVSRRTYPEGRKQKYEDDLLKLSVNDTRDVLKILTHLVGLVEMDKPVSERAAFDFGREYERGQAGA